MHSPCLSQNDHITAACCRFASPDFFFQAEPIELSWHLFSHDAYCFSIPLRILLCVFSAPKQDDDGREAKPFDEEAEMAKLLAESAASAKAAEEDRQARIKAKEDADVAQAIASTTNDAAAAKEELMLVSQRQKEYLAKMLPAEDAKAKPECQVRETEKERNSSRNFVLLPCRVKQGKVDFRNEVYRIEKKRRK
jgi:hypothetical protein